MAATDGFRRTIGGPQRLDHAMKEVLATRMFTIQAAAVTAAGQQTETSL